MKWAHLPVFGGVYDQHPDLLAGFRYIFSARAEHEERERKKDEAKNRANTRNPSTMGRRRR